jgi:hypothetical protein
MDGAVWDGQDEIKAEGAEWQGALPLYPPSLGIYVLDD